MKGISTALNGPTASLVATKIRNEICRFAQTLRDHGVESVRVWCSYNPDLPDDSPLQSPEQCVAPDSITPFFDRAVQNGVWTYGDLWNRAGIESLEGTFSFFLGNDKDIRLGSSDGLLLEEIRSAWTTAGYTVVEWNRERIA